MSKPRLAVINTHVIQHFAPLWRALAARDEVELKAFFCTQDGARAYNDAEFGQTFEWDVDLLGGYDHEFLPLRRAPKAPGSWDTDNPGVGRALEEFDPDIIVLFGYNTLTNWRALAWARRRRVPVLVFSDSELNHPRPLKTRAAKQLVLRSFFSQVDAAMPIGNCNADYYRHYGMPDDVLHWAAYPVDGKRFLAEVGDRAEARREMREEFGIDGSDFVFATIGKFIPRKRHEDVIRAWMALPEDLRERSGVAVIGDGPLRRELEAVAAEAGPKVVLTGFVNQSRIPKLYGACDAVVVASDSDAHPLVVTESLFLGLPVLASSRIGCIGPDDTVRDGENGWVYPYADVEALSRSMRRLITEPDVYERFSKRALELSETQSAEAVADRFVAAVGKVLGAPRPGPAKRARRLVPVAR